MELNNILYKSEVEVDLLKDSRISEEDIIHHTSIEMFRELAVLLSKNHKVVNEKGRFSTNKLSIELLVMDKKQMLDLLSKFNQDMDFRRSFVEFLEKK